MTTGLFLLIHDIIYMLTFILRVFCKKLLYVAQKNVSTKKIFHIKLRCAPKLCESQKMCCGNKKKSFYTQKRNSCWLNMFSVAQKRNTCWTIVPIVYKYMLNWLQKFWIQTSVVSIIKSFVSQEKYFDVAQKLKENVRNFSRTVQLPFVWYLVWEISFLP